MSKSTPPTPDYTGAAQATGDASQAAISQQTYANRPDTNTPWSQTTWNTTPVWDPTTGQYVNQWNQNVNLTPDAQNALTNQLQVQSNLSGTANDLTAQAKSQIEQPIDWSSFTALGNVPQAQPVMNTQPLHNTFDTGNVPQVGSGNSYANTAADAAWQQYTNRNQPIQDRQTSQMQTQLYNQGLRPGDEAYDAAMKTLSQNQGDANTNASLAATQTGIQGGATLQGEDLANNQNTYAQDQGNASFYNNAANQTFQNGLAGQQQNFNQGVASASLSDQTRQQQISEDLQSRGFTLNEIQSLLNGQQVSTGAQPQFNASGAAQPTNYSGAASSQYGAALNSYNAGNANTQQNVMTAAEIAAMFA